jgi:hypothetical protein
MGRVCSRQGSAALSRGHVRVWHLGIALGAMLVVMLLAAGPAMGASIALTGSTLTYTAEGEQNNVSVEQGTDGSLTVTDTVPLTDEDGVGGCNVVDNVATCPPAGSITAEAGDFDDTFTLGSSVTVPAELSGGGGVDTLTGGSGNDTLHLRVNGAGDSASCGAGEDTVDLDLDDVASADCENLDYPPETTLDGPSGIVGNAAELTFTFSSEPGATFQCVLSGPVDGSPPCTSPLSLKDSFASLPDGDYILRITANDAFGHGPPTSRTFTLDTTAPQVIVTQRDPTDTSTAHFQLDVRDANPPVTVGCEIDKTGPVPCSASDILTTPVLADGDYVLFVTGTDAAGNTTITEFPFKINAVKGGGGVGPPTPPALKPTSKIIIDSLVLISGRTVKMSRRGVVRINLTCAGIRRCKGRMKITTAEPVSRKSKKLVTLGSKRFSIGPNKNRKVKVRFSKKRQRLARKLKRFKAKVVINEIDTRGNLRISSRVFTLRAR